MIRIVLALIVSTLAATQAPADDKAALRRLLDLHDVTIFPAPKSKCSCSDEAYAWIERAVEGIEVCCDSGSPFLGGLQNRLSPLVKAGVGVFPYLTVDDGSAPVLRVAVTLPSIDRDKVEEIRVTADDVSRSVPISSAARSRELLFGESRLLSFDFSSDILTQEFLGKIAASKQRVVHFGKEGKRTMKLSKANARSIVEILALHDAMQRDFSQTNK